MSEENPPLLHWKVLVVDDEPDSMAVAQMLLDLYGATVYTALTGHEGLAMARAVLPHFILTDLSMPGMTGWEFLKACQAASELQHIPVIALTAHVSGADREQTLTAGFASYLTKPLKPKNFIQDLLRILQNIPTLATHFDKGDCL